MATSGGSMDAEKCFEVALDHYRKGSDLLNYPVRVLIEEQALHVARATAHFTAGSLAMALAHAQHVTDAEPTQLVARCLHNRNARSGSPGSDTVTTAEGSANMRLVDERALDPGEFVTLVPPGDIHSHGHAIGTGSSPYSLILLGDDMLRFERKEFDLEQGLWRRLGPDEPGRADR
jgi:hypothetical protein